MKTFLIPQSIKQINNRLVKSGFGPLSLRNMELSAQLAKAGLVSDSLVQWYQAAHGVTQSANAVSQWLNLAPSRLALNKNLQQGTASSMPTWLSHAGGVGNNYGYVNGVVGNYFSTPDSAPLSIVGDIDVRAQVSADNWTPAADQRLIAKRDGGTTLSYELILVGTSGTPGTLLFQTSILGTIVVSAISTVIVPMVNFATGWVRATLDVDNGAAGNTTTFYTSVDGVTWTQLGAPVINSGVTSIFNGTQALEIGSRNGGTANLFVGKIFRAQIYNGINGTLAFDFNPATYVSGTTFTDSSVNAATITINGGAVVNIASSLYFDGTDDYLKTGPFVLTQPMTIYFCGRQVTFTTNDSIYEGNDNTNRIRLIQSNPSPQILIFAGSNTAGNLNMAMQTTAVATAIFNGVVSTLQINRTAATTGDAGTNAANGFTLGTRYDASSAFSNITASEILIFNQAHTVGQQNIVIGYLNEKYNLGL